VIATQAVCTAAGPGVANCSCRQGFGGDGYQCYSTIGREISTISQLTSLNQLLQVFFLHRHCQPSLQQWLIFVRHLNYSGFYLNL